MGQGPGKFVAWTREVDLGYILSNFITESGASDVTLIRQEKQQVMKAMDE